MDDTASLPIALTPSLERSPLRDAIGAIARRSEPELLPGLVAQARLDDAGAHEVHELALRIARGVRERARERGRAGLVQGLLQEFALSSHEGVALMCLAEALLRVPDAATRDALIRDKIAPGNWQSHLGGSPSLFVNAATWGLLVTGKLVATHRDTGLTAALRRNVGFGGEPLIRKGVDLAMRMMGEQFVAGQTIELALAAARKREAEGFRYSYDMLGEAAMTAADAERYQHAYEAAIDAIGRASAGRGIYEGPGISIKLSALHPRYSRAKVERVMAEMYPQLLRLAEHARAHDIGLNIDAEEADRCELSLELLERLCHEPSMAGWNGIGFVVQAYLKRCPAVVEYLVDLARRSRRRLMVRLVKGAYWDSEIKHAQVDGEDGYPVYTRKVYTDIAYLACARRLLAAPDAIYPQFATHNAHTLACVYRIAGGNFYAGQYEFQCLHGMGEPLYEQVVGTLADGRLARPCRVYAPVGSHDTLLAYLVRRLLENGANTSFVHRVADEGVSLDELVRDPVQVAEEMAHAEGTLGAPHPAIGLPAALFGAGRRNSRGIDLADEVQLASLNASFAREAKNDRVAEPLPRVPAERRWLPVVNPAVPDDHVGRVQEATDDDVQRALAAAHAAAPAWAAMPPADRAARLEAAADRLEAQTEPLVTLIVREAGRICANAVSEVREAVDFLRYYAGEIRRDFDNATHRPLGPVVCISPWNFPLSIFTGQVAAALAAGNAVIAKPAEQTPLVAAVAVQALHDAGVPPHAVQLLPGRGETVGAALVADARVQGVLFTGSTEVARGLQRTLASRLSPNGQPVALIAETGGQNAMVVDSSALAEQVVQDIVTSAFDSAGQRCSALRVLCVQRDAADRIVEMLIGAIRELEVGDPRQLAVDVGPVIDADARTAVERHVAAMRAKGRRIEQPLAGTMPAHGSFVTPTLIELERLSELEREVFGPALHVLRYDRDELPALLQSINATGYGLTGGVHTRIDETVAEVAGVMRAGNLYVNRNVVGAVVGVQPFGGEGLSGTGPKAGGPLYLLRLLAVKPADAARRAIAAAGADAAPPVRGFDVGADRPAIDPALAALRAWARADGESALAACCDRAAAQTPVGRWRSLAGPTGEADLYAALPREAVLCLAASDGDRLCQLAAVLAVGSRAVWPADTGALRERLPEDVRERIALAQDWAGGAARFDAVLHSGSADELKAVAATLAALPGPIVGVTALGAGDDLRLERLVVERSVSVNTAAAGGNASLMTIG